MLVTVKEWLKSVLNYQSYPKNKTGYPVFRPPCIVKNAIQTYLYYSHNDKDKKKQ